MKQLIAENHMMGMRIIVRFIDGIKYLKVTPRNLIPLIKQGITKQLGIGVEVKESDGWLQIKKTKEKHEGLQKVTDKLKETEDQPTEEDILNKEAEFMKQAGYVVRIEEI